MTELTICDRCGKRTTEDSDWEYAFKKDLCPKCIKEIVEFIEAENE
jgi:hypothetical protein